MAERHSFKKFYFGFTYSTYITLSHLLILQHIQFFHRLEAHIGKPPHGINGLDLTLKKWGTRYIGNWLFLRTDLSWTHQDDSPNPGDDFKNYTYILKGFPNNNEAKVSTHVQERTFKFCLPKAFLYRVLFATIAWGLSISMFTNPLFISSRTFVSHAFILPWLFLLHDSSLLPWAPAWLILWYY